MKAFIVWNESKTEGFVTTDKGLAYEIRKGAISNAYTENGDCSYIGIAFAMRYLHDNCTSEEVEVAERLADGDWLRSQKDVATALNQAAEGNPHTRWLQGVWDNLTPEAQEMVGSLSKDVMP